MKKMLMTFAVGATMMLQAGTMAYSPESDLVPGFRVAAKVRVNSLDGMPHIIRKGDYEQPGFFLLRVNPKNEGSGFAFFANTDGQGCEPRVNASGKVQVGKEYDVEAGWDGTNVWISVDGKVTTRKRVGTGARVFKSLTVADGCASVRDVKFGNAQRYFEEFPLQCGLTLACKVKFDRELCGETELFKRGDEYMLRYDQKKGNMAGQFSFFVKLNGGWESRVAVTVKQELGKVYDVAANWNGSKLTLNVDGQSSEVKRKGRPNVGTAKTKISNMVSDLMVFRDMQPNAEIWDLKTKELLVYEGDAFTVQGECENFGMDLKECRLVASVPEGETVEPKEVDLGNFQYGTHISPEWKITAGKGGLVNLKLTLMSGKRKMVEVKKQFVRMQRECPDYSAWNAPVKPMKTYYVDSVAGDDANDGLSKSKAWKTFARIRGLELKAGERLLLRRGCVFNEELLLTANGSAENWAEIGAYGEGMRPQIRRNRDLSERCGEIEQASYLVVHDLIFCNAGAGFIIRNKDSGKTHHILVERCLAHHIEGMYRINSHGIPEWRNKKPAGAGRSCGILVNGDSVMMRNCESYQCSSGWSVGGTDAIVTRMFCHDNYGHNTSPHPYNTTSRAWMTDCVFDASGWHAAAGTMGVMLWGNVGYVIRGCHFLNQPDSGSPDQGGIDFEARGDNCIVENCTFRNNAGAAIEVLGLRSPQTHNVVIRKCKFDRNNWAMKNGPAEIQIWGNANTPAEIACANGRIEGNGYVLLPGVPFYVNETRYTNNWVLANNREFAYSDDLDAAFPYAEVPKVEMTKEIWTDRTAVPMVVRTDANAKVTWDQVEGREGVRFENANAAKTTVHFPGEGDYRLNASADNGTLWRAGRTAVHVLPKGGVVYKAWTFAKNLDTEGWTAENTGTQFEFLPGKTSFWNSHSMPVKLVCGDYYVIAVKESGEAAITTSDTVSVGVEANGSRANTMLVKMQNHTPSTKMRLYWQTQQEPTWDEKNSLTFDVNANDADDTVYRVKLPLIGGIKQLRLKFSADGAPITGTVRIDYIALARIR